MIARVIDWQLDPWSYVKITDIELCGPVVSRSSSEALNLSSIIVEGDI